MIRGCRVRRPEAVCADRQPGRDRLARGSLWEGSKTTMDGSVLFAFVDIAWRQILPGVSIGADHLVSSVSADRAGKTSAG